MRPHLDLQTRAVSYLLQCHLEILTDVPYVLERFSDCFHKFKISGKPHPVVELALSALALAVFSQTQHYPAAATEASSQYDRLLRFMQALIAQVGKLTLGARDIDSYLLTILFMARYEAVTNRPASTLSWSHQDGALAILKLWNDHSANGCGSAVVRQSRKKLIKSSLLRQLSLPNWVLNGARFGEHGLSLEFDRIFVRIVYLHHAAASIQNTQTSHIPYVIDLDIEAQELDNALRNWAAHLPTTWSYQQHVLTQSGPWPRTHFYSPVVYTYSQPGHAAVWSQFFVARMLINNARLKLLESSPRHLPADFTYDEGRLHCRTQLNDMADSLAATIPFCLQRFKVAENGHHQHSVTINADEEIRPCLAYLVTWPWTLASSLSFVCIRQQQWFRSELAQVGKVLGDGVLALADTDHWAIC